jgi:hypothetical protein
VSLDLTWAPASIHEQERASATAAYCRARSRDRSTAPANSSANRPRRPTGGGQTRSTCGGDSPGPQSLARTGPPRRSSSRHRARGAAPPASAAPARTVAAAPDGQGDTAPRVRVAIAHDRLHDGGAYDSHRCHRLPASSRLGSTPDPNRRTAAARPPNGLASPSLTLGPPWTPLSSSASRRDLAGRQGRARTLALNLCHQVRDITRSNVSGAALSLQDGGRKTEIEH